MHTGYVYVTNVIARQVPYGAKFDGGNIDEFDEFPTICQYFPYQNFTFSHLPLMNLAIRPEIKLY